MWLVSSNISLGWRRRNGGPVQCDDGAQRDDDCEVTSPSGTSRGARIMRFPRRTESLPIAAGKRVGYRERADGRRGWRSRSGCNAMLRCGRGGRHRYPIERKTIRLRFGGGGPRRPAVPASFVTMRSAPAPAVGDAACDQIPGDFAQQMLRERAGAALSETKQFDEILRSEAHVGLLRRGASPAPPQNMKFSLS